MKALEMAEGRGPNPYYAGNFDGESDELRDLRLSLVAERDALKADETPEKQIKRTLRDLYQEVLAERDALKAENERLTNCLKKANDQAEDFERRWYLADMELERIKALEPVAWLSTDCIGERHLSFGRPHDIDPTPLIALGSKHD